MRQCIALEPAAEKVCRAAAVPPLIFQMPPEQGRAALEKIQDEPVYKYPARVLQRQVCTGEWGDIKVYFICPDNDSCQHSLIFYIHGAGWVFGSYHTHEKLVRELAARTNSIVVFPEYSRAPEAPYPKALEQCYSVLCQLPGLLQEMQLLAAMETLTVAGDSAGGNMAIAMSLMAQCHNGPKIHKQLLYYPVTNACFDTGSYCQFASGYYLYRLGMMWFWDQYMPCLEDRNQLTASPLRGSSRQISCMPATMILNGEADVLRDEGETLAEKLRVAGVDVTALRFQGIIHDFVMLNSLDQTNACRAAMDVSTDWINRKNWMDVWCKFEG